MSKRRPQNGPTLTKGKPIRKPPTASNLARENAQEIVDRLDAVRHQRFHRLKKQHGLLGALARMKDNE
jgi:hypothetical protein